MKKLASVLLVVTMVFGLVACGSQEKNQENNKCNKKNMMASNIIFKDVMVVDIHCSRLKV